MCSVKNLLAPPDQSGLLALRGREGHIPLLHRATRKKQANERCRQGEHSH